MEKIKPVSVVELKRLLITIIDYNLPICFRYRLLGEMWQPNFLKIVRVTEKGAVLNDELNNRLLVIHDLSQIMQFELDGRIHNFEPNHHYDLTYREA